MPYRPQHVVRLLSTELRDVSVFHTGGYVLQFVRRFFVSKSLHTRTDGVSSRHLLFRRVSIFALLVKKGSQWRLTLFQWLVH